MTTMTQSAYAQHARVDRKTIGRWIKSGKFIVMDGELIDVEATDAALAKTGMAKIYVRPTPKEKTADVSTEQRIENDAQEMLLVEGASLSREEAARIKENYLAMLTKLEFEKESGQLIDMVKAEEVLFIAFRQQRDAWLNWPSRVAPLMAADLDVPADKMTEVLIEHVHKHISVLGEPEFNPGED